ncbi:fluoride efflux transporter CrcB [Bacillus sp. V5-8f]|uniref:fluoride efflux transporter CrcB n=1 Tax=Bacillus sp. V5-8f TaxID=2053044 RepID=UPI000C75F855|nr:fluoride efflux transporter CrcB [Bacillus sp. V5-8f]PLT33367.1 fluoride efflux transporter CrcB [Bacillus sp. V5-8f]
MFYQLLLVGAGGFFGAITRYAVTVFFSRLNLFFFPLGTFLINVSGSFLLGFLLGCSYLSPSQVLFWATGFLGAFTTFSTFNYELLMLKMNKRLTVHVLYFLSSYIVGCLFAALGYSLGIQFQIL